VIPVPILQGSGTEEVNWTCTDSSYNVIFLNIFFLIHLCNKYRSFKTAPSQKGANPYLSEMIGNCSGIRTGSNIFTHS